MSSRILLEPTYKSIISTLKASNRLNYVKNKNILSIPKQNIPNTDYIIYLYPVSISNLPQTETGLSVNVSYIIIVGCRIMISDDMEEQLYGTTTKKGLMDVVSDIYFTIKDSPNFGINSSGTAISTAGSSTSYVLSSSVKYLSIILDDWMSDQLPSGYDQIDCGSSSLTGTQIAENIQTSLRALGNSLNPEDPYSNVTCTYDNSEKSFTITSPTIGTRSSVEVSSGLTNDASSVLGFTRHKNTRGANIVVSRIGVTYPPPNEEFLPAIHGRLELYIEEQIYFE